MQFNIRIGINDYTYSARRVQRFESLFAAWR